MLAEKVRKLGGVVVEGIYWRETITHVVTNKFDDYKETVLGALAAGRWVVTKRYIDRSFVAGAWKDEKAFIAHEDVGKRVKARQDGEQLFKGLKVLFLLEDQLKAEVYTRLVKAGGGEVVDIWGLKKLIETQPGPEELNLVVGDCDLLSKNDVRHELFKQWIQLCQECDSLVPHVYYMYLFQSITSPIKQDPSTWSIFLPSTVQKAREEGHMKGRVNFDLEGLKKRTASGGEEDRSAKKRAKKDNGDATQIVFNSSATKIVSVTLPANVQTVTLEDSDDDLEVLEERVAQRCQLGRRYKEDVEVFRERKRHEVVQVSGSEEESGGISDISDNEIQVLEHEKDSGGEEARIGGYPFGHNQGGGGAGRPVNIEAVMNNGTPRGIEADVVVNQEGPRQAEGGLDLSRKSQEKKKDQENNDSPEARKAALFQRFLQRAREAEQREAPSIPPTISPPTTSASSSSSSSLNPKSLNLGASSSEPKQLQLRDDPILASRAEPLVLTGTPSTSTVSSKEADSKREKSSKASSHLKKNVKVSSGKDASSVATSSKKAAMAPVSVVNPRIAIPLPAPATLPTPVIEGQDFERLVSAVQERQTGREECLTISTPAPGKLYAFDKHKEGRRKGESLKVEQVAAFVKEEFQQFGKSGGDGAEGLQVTSYVSSLRYLKGCTSSFVLPSPSILNKLMTEHILDQRNPCVRRETVHYLNHILFVYLGRREVIKGNEYTSWQQMVLGSMMKENQDAFDMEDKRQVAESGSFFASLLQRSREVAGSGVTTLVHYLAKLLQRDFEVWWREQRRRSSETRPLLHYLLGGEGRILGGIKSTIVPVYSRLLNYRKNQDILVLPSPLDDVRNLLALGAHLIAFHDAQEKQNKALAGKKLELGSLLAGALAPLNKADQEDELFLLQPSWLSWLTSRALLEMTTSLRIDSLSSLFSNIKLDATPAFCTLAYRLLSCNHVHALHSTAWQLQVAGSKGLVMWKGLDKVPEGGDSQKEGRTVRWRNEVGVERKELLKEMNTLLEVTSGQKDVVAETSSVLKALLFKRTSPTDY